MNTEKQDTSCEASAKQEHSPLPWRYSQPKGERPACVHSLEGDCVAVCRGVVAPNSDNAAFIVRSCNNAQRLADALKSLFLDLDENAKIAPMPSTVRRAREALAQWEKAQ